MSAVAKAKLLVVDDEQVVCESCSRIFTGQGFEVETSTDSYQGLRLATEGDFAAILLDFKMPVMDGIEFLEALRKTNPNVPVIMITGYSTVPSAAAAMRMGARDYIPKPFTPDEILTAVRRIVATPEGPRTADASKTSTTSVSKSEGNAAPVAVAAPVSHPVSSPKSPTPRGSLLAAVATLFPVHESDSGSISPDDFYFLDSAWFKVGADGLVRAGAFLARNEAAALRSARLPLPGEFVHQGLPLAVFSTADGKTRTIPSPVTGEVVAVNPAIAERPAELWNDPCQDGWIARIRPTHLTRDAVATRTRDVVVAAGEETVLNELRADLVELGCKVHESKTSEGVSRLLEATKANLLIVDAGSYGDNGPELVESVNHRFPSVKIVVFAGPDSARESAYRTRRILYYALQPFADNEIIDILAAAFQPGTPAVGARETKSAWLPKTAHRVRLTNRLGHRVALLASGALLQPETGLGRQIIQTLLDESYPVEVDYGTKTYGLMDILSEAEAFDRVVILKAENLDRIPGALARNVKRELLHALGEKREKVVTLVVQPNPDTAGALEFGPSTTRFLAGHVAEELAEVGA